MQEMTKEEASEFLKESDQIAHYKKMIVLCVVIFFVSITIAVVSSPTCEVVTQRTWDPDIGTWDRVIGLMTMESGWPPGWILGIISAVVTGMVFLYALGRKAVIEEERLS